MKHRLLYIEVWMLLGENEFQKLKQGDRDIVKILYNTYRCRLISFLRNKKYSLTDDDIYEIIHIVFIKILKHSQTLKDQKNLGGWIFTICHNEYCNYLKRIHQENKIKDRIQSEHQLSIVESRESDLSETLNFALECLKPIYKKVIILKYYNNKPQKEIAKLLNKTEGAVEQLLIRAKKKLQKIINLRINAK